MKLRLYRDSIRFRLSPRDVGTLQTQGTISETTRFGAGVALTYTIRLSSAGAPRATLDSNSLVIELPRATARDWAEGESVSLQHSQSVGADETLSILIEKDFECLDAVGDEMGEALYPNPNGACS